MKYVNHAASLRKIFPLTSLLVTLTGKTRGEGTRQREEKGTGLKTRHYKPRKKPPV
jgi:hypothetical protein